MGPSLLGLNLFGDGFGAKNDHRKEDARRKNGGWLAQMPTDQAFRPTFVGPNRRVETGWAKIFLGECETLGVDMVILWVKEVFHYEDRTKT